MWVWVWARVCVWASLWVRVWACLGAGVGMDVRGCKCGCVVCGGAGVWERQCVGVFFFFLNFQF